MEYNKDIIQNEDLNLDFYSMIRAVLKDWFMILTAGLLGIIVAFFMAEMAYNPEYTTSMTFIVSSKGATSSLSNASAANAMAETFSEVLNSRLLKEKVKDELNLSYMPGTISTTVVAETNLMTLSVSAPSPEDSFKIMKSVLNNYSDITDLVLPNVVLDVLEAPKVPTGPSNPISRRDMMKQYAIYGMISMAFLLAFIDYMRDDIKNEKEVEKKLDTKLFGTIYHEEKNKTIKAKLRNKKRGLLVNDPRTSFMFAENYKKIRTKILYRAKTKDTKVILVTSVMENEGKSTVAVNLAVTFAQKMERVLLIDGDMRRPAAYKILSKKLQKKQEIGEYIKGKSSIQDIISYDRDTNLYLAIGAQAYSNSTEMVSNNQMKEFIQWAKTEFDFIIIDSPPISLMADSEVMAEYADVSLLVVRQSMARTKDINDAIDMMEGGNSHLLGCIFNDVKTGVFTGRKSWGGGYGYGYGNRYNGYGNYGHYGRYGRVKKPSSRKMREKHE
ncbi:MAG: polysaccharide biosynthesis tyrosine autokinase [Lachnospiraceae bacterium]|nr:polysaccharide biosynthesis tyrosine autokinase [Lachnospiraceae bacterium]